MPDLPALRGLSITASLPGTAGGDGGGSDKYANVTVGVGLLV